MNDREYEIMFRREDAYWWYRGMRAVTRAFAPGVFARAAGARALDAGCGTGRNLVDLAAGGPAVGVDLSLRALGFARRRGAAPLVCASVEALPFRTASLRGGAFARRPLHGAGRRARRARDRARPRAGRGVSRSRRRRSTRSRARTTSRSAPSGATRRAASRSSLKDAGLAVVRTTYANFFLAGPIWILRKVTGAKARGRPREEVRSDFGLAPKPLEEIFFFLLSIEARILARWPSAVRSDGARPRGETRSGRGHERGGEVARVVRPVVDEDRVRGDAPARNDVDDERRVGERRGPHLGEDVVPLHGAECVERELPCRDPGSVRGEERRGRAGRQAGRLDEADVRPAGRGGRQERERELTAGPGERAPGRRVDCEAVGAARVRRRRRARGRVQGRRRRAR